MTHNTAPGRPEGEKGYQPTPDAEEQRGYQPEASGPVNPADLEPPHTDTAIAPPEKPTAKQ